MSNTFNNIITANVSGTAIIKSSPSAYNNGTYDTIHVYCGQVHRAKGQGQTERHNMQVSIPVNKWTQELANAVRYASTQEGKKAHVELVGRIVNTRFWDGQVMNGENKGQKLIPTHYLTLQYLTKQDVSMVDKEGFVQGQESKSVVTTNFEMPQAEVPTEEGSDDFGVPY